MGALPRKPLRPSSVLTAYRLPPAAYCLSLYRVVAHAERHELLEKLRVGDAGGFGGVGKVVFVCDVGVGVGFEEVELAVVGHAVVEARVAAEHEEAIDTAREVFELTLLLG